MAISPITVGDTNARAKINDAITKANLVDSKANSSALTTEAAARLAADQAEAAARLAADQAEATARSNGDALRPKFTEMGISKTRPGEPGAFFGYSVDGLPDSILPVGNEFKTITNNGSVVVVDGSQTGGGFTLSTVPVFSVEPGHQYRIRFVFRRITNSPDPSNDTVSMGVRWLNNAKGPEAFGLLLHVLDLTTSNGRVEYAFNVSTSDAPNIDLIAPSGAVYFRPFIVAYGNGVTEIEVIEVTDLSIAVDWSPDVTELRNQIAGIQAQLDAALDRIEVLEAP